MTITATQQIKPTDQQWVDRYPAYDGLDFGDTSSDSLYEED